MSAETAPNVTRFSTVMEVADALRVHKMTVYRLVESGELPAYKFRGAYRIPTAAVWSYIEGAIIDPQDVSYSRALKK